MAQGLDDLLDDAKKKGSEIWSSIKSSGKEKLKKGIQNLNNALPEIETAGFELVRLDVDIALLPRIFARFKQIRVISDTAQETMLTKTKKNKFYSACLRPLALRTTLKLTIWT